DGKKVSFRNTRRKIIIDHSFKKGKTHQLELNYTATPKQTVYFLGWEDGIMGNEQIWTQGQGKYTSHWLPSFDDMTEKIQFNLHLIPPSNTRVISNGKRVRERIRNGRAYQAFEMKSPMSSYLLAFAMGHYNKKVIHSTSGVPIELYYYPGDSLKVGPTYRFTKRIFDFLEKEIGVPYPWQNYKQVPVRDFLYAGMENTGCTLFSDGYMIDSIGFVDHNYVNVNAHELAHQWFGNLVTEVNGSHHWLHEGFATYFALLAEAEIFGEDHMYWKMYDTMLALTKEGTGESLLDPKASSLTFYEKGAWALALLQEQLGDTIFRKGIQRYLRKFQFGNATIPDFLTEMASVSGQDLSAFRQEWLVSSRFPRDKAKGWLGKKSKSLRNWFSMEEKLATATPSESLMKSFWDKATSSKFKEHLIRKYGQKVPKEVVMDALLSDDIHLQQAAVSVADLTNEGFKVVFEGLLTNPSYRTQEQVLFKVWLAYPENRDQYLDKTADISGLPNKNIRLLWLALALLSPEYQPERTNEFFQELVSYTDSKYSWEIRMGAIDLLHQIQAFDSVALLNLLMATEHHTWQFRKFARNLVGQLIESPDMKSQINFLSKKLNKEEYRYIHTKLLHE
ncbi:MAG: M1 family metallopeptidase, partial [Flavobacteriaceae bacterium]